MSSEPHVPNTILVVEDNDLAREGLAAVLRRDGYAVAAAANGREALDYLGHNYPAPALIVLDMLMPVLDGWAFLAELGRLPLSASVPVLITTSTILTGEWAAEHRCAGLLRKPVESDVLLTAVRRCLAASA